VSVVRTVVCVHGAGTGPWVFDGWADAFPGSAIVAVDLQEGLDVPRATMADYAAAVVHGAAGRDRPLAVCGWSLGGLASMLAAAPIEPEALVLLEASPPLELQGLRDDAGPEVGTFDPEVTGAPFPWGVRARPESSFAMGERDRGVSVPLLPEATRVLAVAGAAYRAERGVELAERYGADFLDVGSATHWDLVLDPGIRGRIAAWLAG
jgi:pimeloyl-ACP methyl ester carboxylesterase